MTDKTGDPYGELAGRIGAQQGLRPVQRPCRHCRQEIPTGKRLYCSERCGHAHRQMRYLAAHPERGGR